MQAFKIISISEGSVTEPVSLDDLKSWLKVDFDDEDDAITAMGKAARQAIEKITSLHMVAKAVTLDAELTKPNFIVLPFTSAPQSVVVKELDSQDSETTLTSGTDYFKRGNEIRIERCGRYTISYTTTPNVNADLLQAIKMEVAERYKNRGENAKEYAASPVGLSEAAKQIALLNRVEWL